MGDSGYPEYDNNRLNSCARVAARLQVRYSQKNAEKYNEATFTLQAVQDAVRQLDKTEAPSLRRGWRLLQNRQKW